ncbi:MAG TPA: MBL fold metallo-hydrolase [Balneolaceae bacterium]|nr:MBL fold metallo-hydrolase [Balneolaceae bacterium]
MPTELSTGMIGNFELTAIETGRFRLDGGAMFGVVPKTLWSKKLPADEKNRIPMAMRCLLVKSRATDKIYLIDNGSGTKFNDKMERIYALDYDHSNLTDSLSSAGIKPSDITDVIFSHLHFDHCGGTTFYDDKGELKHLFENATYHVNKRHWNNANNPNTREQASFLTENIEPISESGRLNLVSDNHEFENGFDTIPVNGHTIGQQLPRIQDENRTLLFAADLLPTFAHVPIPWVMGYDMYPVQTLEEKETILHKAAENNWHFFMEHDADNEIITVKKENNRFSFKNAATLSTLL